MYSFLYFVSQTTPVLLFFVIRNISQKHLYRFVLQQTSSKNAYLPLLGSCHPPVVVSFFRPKLSCVIPCVYCLWNLSGVVSNRSFQATTSQGGRYLNGASIFSAHSPPNATAAIDIWFTASFSPCARLHRPSLPNFKKCVARVWHFFLHPKLFSFFCLETDCSWPQRACTSSSGLIPSCFLAHPPLLSLSLFLFNTVNQWRSCFGLCLPFT